MVAQGTGGGSTSIAFRQNIAIQFGSNLLPVEREEAGTPHPCVSVSIRGQIACFLWRSVSFRSLVFGHGWTRIHTDRMFRFLLKRYTREDLPLRTAGSEP